MKDGRGYMQLIRMEVAAGSFSSAPLHLKCLFPLFLEMHLSVFPHCYHLNWTTHSSYWRIFPFWRSPLHASDPRLLCDVVIFVQKKRYCDEKKPLVPLFTCNTSWYIHRRLLQRDYSDYYLSITCVCPFESTMIVLQNSERADGSMRAKPLLSPLDGHEFSSRG